MNLSYYRQSKFDYDKTVANISSQAKKLGLMVHKPVDLPKGQGVIVQIVNPEWVNNVLRIDQNLLGFIPANIVVLKKGKDTEIGVASPNILSEVTRDPRLSALSKQISDTITTIIHASAGVEALKPQSVKLFSTESCPYCKMEAAWLDSQNVEYEMVMVDSDQKSAEEMVQKTGQMGVPVTIVDYGEGMEDVVVGFDRDKLTSILGV